MIRVTIDTALVLQWHRPISLAAAGLYGIMESHVCSLRETRVLVLWHQIWVQKTQTNPKFPLLQSLIPGSGRSRLQSSVWWERGEFLQIDGLEWILDWILPPNGGSAAEDSPNYRNPNSFVPPFVLIVHL